MVAKPSMRRLTLLFAVGAVLCAGLGIRIAQIQIRDGETYRQRARDQQHRVVTIDPRRGRIFDRNRNTLALSVEFDSFGIQDLDWDRFDPSDVGNLAVQLSQVTGEDPQHIVDRISGSSDFRYLVRWVNPEISERIKGLSAFPRFEPYIRTEKEARRVYPYRTAAGQVLGFSVDGDGRAGFELVHNQLLSGNEGYSVVQIDAQRRAYSWLDDYQQAAENGADVVLTIDIAAQVAAEGVLEEAIALHEALGGMVIMMDPANGDILAMASSPNFDPNTPGRFPFEAQKIRPVVDIYEPGSTFKLVAATAALETGAFSLEDRIDTRGGRIDLGTQTISDHEVFDELTVREVFVHSSNVGTVKNRAEARQKGVFQVYPFIRFRHEDGRGAPGRGQGNPAQTGQMVQFDAADHGHRLRGLRYRGSARVRLLRGGERGASPSTPDHQDRPEKRRFRAVRAEVRCSQSDGRRNRRSPAGRVHRSGGPGYGDKGRRTGIQGRRKDRHRLEGA